VGKGERERDRWYVEWLICWRCRADWRRAGPAGQYVDGLGYFLRVSAEAAVEAPVEMTRCRCGGPLTVRWRVKRR
jgi:hypothetical protein